MRAIAPIAIETAMEIRDLTGFSYQFPGDLGENELPDLIVVYGPPEMILDDAAYLGKNLRTVGFEESVRELVAAGEPACTTGATWGQDHAIGTIVLTVDSTGPVERCVKEGTLRSIGLVSGLGVLDASILASDQDRDGFTALDRAVLSALYSGTFEAGDTPSVDKIVRVVSALMPKEI